MQIKCRDYELKHSFYTLPQINSSKHNCSREMKTMQINGRAVYGFQSIEIGLTPVTKLCDFLNIPPTNDQKCM